MPDHPSFLSRLFRPKPAAAPPIDPDLYASLQSDVLLNLRTGFTSAADAEESITDILQDDAPNLTPAQITATANDLVSGAAKKLGAEQRSWPATTDCDRLDAAFATLAAQGLIARHHFWCCQNCAHAALDEEIDALRAAPPSSPATMPRGYTFYHAQDTERAAAGGPLYLAFDSIGGNEQTQAAIGHEIVAVLDKHGLKCDWNGSTTKRIAVLLTWQRRRAPIGWSSAGIGC